MCPITTRWFEIRDAAPMRIVALADTHLFTEDLDAIPDGDVLVHAGDLLRGGDLDELKRGIAFMKALPHKHKLFIPGNHDRCFEESFDQAIKLCGEIKVLLDDHHQIEGVNFYGSPWQPAYNEWAFNLKRGEALKQKWDAIPFDTHILVTHGPPYGVLDGSKTKGRHGCEELLAAVVKRQSIKLHLFGHIHESGGVFERDALFANVTTWECERAATVIDFIDQKAVPVFVPPRGSL